MNNLYFNKVFWFLNKQTNTTEIFGSVSAICAKEDEDQQEQVNANVDKMFDDFLERKRDIEAVNNVILVVEN